MAGIGFELQRLMDTHSVAGQIKANSMAAIIACGPWILSIVTLMVMGAVSLHAGMGVKQLHNFLISVTYIMAFSLILSGGFQLLLTRYTADLIFIDHPEQILGNMFGCLLLVALVCFPLAIILLFSLEAAGAGFAVLAACMLPVMGVLWIQVLFLSSIKSYRTIVSTLLGCYGAIMLLTVCLSPQHESQLMMIFWLGHVVAAVLFFWLIVKAFPGQATVAFDFLNSTRSAVTLFCCGLLYNVAIWADKFVFWLSPTTSNPIIGLFNESLFYDLPIFLANLIIIPGLAVFLLSTETNFAQKCLDYFRQLNGHANLSQLRQLKQALLDSYQRGFYLLCKVQGVSLLLVMLFSDSLFGLLGLDRVYLPLFRIDLVGMSFLVILISQLNTLYYLDRLVEALAMVAVMAFTNIAFSMASIEMGIRFYGYGFSLSMIFTTLVGFYLLNRSFARLEFNAFIRHI